MKKTVRLTENDLIRLVKRIINEQNFPTREEAMAKRIPLTQDNLNKLKAIVQNFYKEMEIFSGVLNTMITSNKLKNIKLDKMRYSDVVYFSAEEDRESEDLLSFIKKYNEQFEDTKQFTKNLLNQSFDVNKLKLIEYKNFYFDKGKQLIKENISIYSPAIDRFIKACDKFKEDFDNIYWNVNFNGKSTISQGLYDLRQRIFEWRIYRGAQELKEFLQKIK